MVDENYINMLFGIYSIVNIIYLLVREFGEYLFGRWKSIKTNQSQINWNDSFFRETPKHFQNIWKALLHVSCQSPLISIVENKMSE